jgi:hypothetical protein
MTLALEHSSSPILCHFGLTVLIGRIGLQQLSARLDFSDGMNLPPESHRTLKTPSVTFVAAGFGSVITTVRGIGTSTSGIGSGAKFDVITRKVVAPPPEPLGHPDIEEMPTYLVKVENHYIMVKI